jgi:hypothetical protein
MSTAKIYGQDLGLVRVSDLLPALSAQASARSGGPPFAGAVLQDDNDGQLVWSQITGFYLLGESGEQLTSESGEVLISEGA